MPRYSLNDFSSIIFNGFDIELSEETLHIINDLAMHVGSPTYVKTPVFNKKSIVEVNDQTDYKRKKRNKESDSDSWAPISSGFHATLVVNPGYFFNLIFVCANILIISANFIPSNSSVQSVNMSLLYKMAIFSVNSSTSGRLVS